MSHDTRKASHDSDLPPRFRAFLLDRWRPFDAAPPTPVSPAFAARRARLSAAMPGVHLVVPTGHEKVRANDTHHRFRPGSDFAWLTGNHEPDSVLVLVAQADGTHRSVLYVEPVNRTDTTFFTDRNKGELWVGRRLGVDMSQIRYAVDEARSLAELRAELAALTGPRALLRGVDPALDAVLPPAEHDARLGATSSELRLVKDDDEVAALEAVIHSTQRGFEDVLRGLSSFRTERDVEVAFFARARTEGNDVGYGTIAAAGDNATILHWTRNDAPLVPGTLLLLDAGVEGHDLYTADITRTFPIGGRFSPEQRAIYDLVWRASREAIAMIRPGVDFMAPNRRAMTVLAQGLEALGLLPSADEALADEHQFYRRYSLHNISHMLGIDVHDCARARQETYKFGALRPGMVFTVEPGLYFQRDDLSVPERYRGIGVRIEDDILVTADGHRNLSAHLPSQADEVEAWMARCAAEAVTPSWR